MGFVKIVFKYGTFKDKYKIIKELIRSRHQSERVKVEYLMLMFVRMSILILNNAWALQITNRVKDMIYIDEFANYLIEINDIKVFRGVNEKKFTEFIEVYEECYKDFLSSNVL